MNSKLLLFTFKLLLLSVVFHCCKHKQTAPNPRADDKVQFSPFAVHIHKEVYLTCVLL